MAWSAWSLISHRFVQLIVTVFKNLDTLLPAIYDGIIPKAIETLFATIFIAYAYHWICVIQPVVFALYTYLAYVGAKDKAKRNADMMNARVSAQIKCHARADSRHDLHAIDETYPRRTRVDGVGRPKFDSHTGRY